MLTCKQFLRELSGYLEKTLDPAELAELQKHVNECPNCFVVCDTTEKTLKVFKGMEAKAIPKDIHSRLMAAIERKLRDKGGCG
ncbi:MAG TPA: anti-sigma factor [Bryobacteraceae bacterium]